MVHVVATTKVTSANWQCIKMFFSSFRTNEVEPDVKQKLDLGLEWWILPHAIVSGEVMTHFYFLEILTYITTIVGGVINFKDSLISSVDLSDLTIIVEWCDDNLCSLGLRSLSLSVSIQSGISFSLILKPPPSDVTSFVSAKPLPSIFPYCFNLAVGV